MEKKEIKKKSENLSEWYTDVVLKAELADYGPARGTMVVRPYGYAIWEGVQEAFNEMMKEKGVQNAYFPLFIPYSLIQRESKHVEGFSPELALVTHGGGQELSEPLVVRPTSETVMYAMYSKWISSWRDLPMKINQWNSVVRWEKRTYLFLRSMEFLWQEGHTAHETEAEAVEMTLDALEWYRRVHEDYLAVPVVMGVKSEAERFAGAAETYAIESLMPDGRALQSATSHNLAQNFSKAFNISFQTRESGSEYAWQTSWGLSTRSIGGMFMIHGDDDGLVIPPRIAPYQVVVVPVYRSDGDRAGLDSYIEDVLRELSEKKIRHYFDKRDTQSVGRKFNEWEVKGAPIRLEIGETEKNDAKITIKSRIDEDKISVDRESMIDEITSLIDGIQDQLYQRASLFLKENTHEVDSYDDFKNIMNEKKGFIKAFWCEDPKCEASIKEETKATTRVKPLGDDEDTDTGKCVYCGKESKNKWYFAQSY